MSRAIVLQALEERRVLRIVYGGGRDFKRVSSVFGFVVAEVRTEPAAES